MDPKISAVAIGGVIAAVSGVLTQIVVHVLQRLARRKDREHDRKVKSAEEVICVTSEFVDAVYSLKLRLDGLLGYLAGLVEGRSPEEVEARREQKTAKYAAGLSTDRVTALSVHLWQVRIADDGDVASTAEEIVERVKDYFSELRVIQSSREHEDWSGVREGRKKCWYLKNVVEELLRRLAKEVRDHAPVA